MSLIDMQTMRYINLLDRESNVKTRRCFNYNNMIVFAVPKLFISRAIGPDARNVRRMQDQIGKRIKIVAEPSGIEDAQKFVQDVVSPLSFTSLEIRDNEFVLTAGSESKAALIGRNKRRLMELSKMMKDLFGKELKIV